MDPSSERPVLPCPACGRKFRLGPEAPRSFECSACGATVDALRAAWTPTLPPAPRRLRVRAGPWVVRGLWLVLAALAGWGAFSLKRPHAFPGRPVPDTRPWAWALCTAGGLLALSLLPIELARTRRRRLMRTGEEVPAELLAVGEHLGLNLLTGLLQVLSLFAGQRSHYVGDDEYPTVRVRFLTRDGTLVELTRRVPAHHQAVASKPGTVLSVLHDATDPRRVLVLPSADYRVVGAREGKG